MLKYTYILFFLLLFEFVACQPIKKANYAPRKTANTFFLADQNSEKWKLLQSFDPYNGGVTTVQPKEDPYFVTFEKNGRFTEYEKNQHSSGKWFLNKEKTELVLIYSIQNGIAVNKKKPQMLTFQIRKREGKNRVLAIQGRHGWVEKSYLWVE